MPNDSNPREQNVEKARNGEKGFTLLEMIVAMVIFLLVTGAIWGLLQVAQQSRTVTNQTVQLTKSMRLGLNLVGRDTLNAGFGYPLVTTSKVLVPELAISALLTLPPDANTTRDEVPPIIAGNNRWPNALNENPTVMTDQVTFLFRDTTFNLIPAASPPEEQLSQALRINASTTTAGIDEIVPISGSNAVCNINDIYLITGNTGSALGLATGLNGTDKVQFANADVLGLNQTGPGGPLADITTPASMQKVLMVTYFVTAEGILTRRQHANIPPNPVGSPPIAWVDEPLVYDVEDFQIEYVLNDGTVTDDPSANLSAIRQVRYTISVRGTQVGPGNRPFQETMTSTFSTRNLGYQAG